MCQVHAFAIQELVEAGVPRELFRGIDMRRGGAEFASRVLQCRELSAPAAAHLLRRSILCGDVATVEELLSRGHTRQAVCLGVAAPMDLDECHGNCNHYEPCPNCRLGGIESGSPGGTRRGFRFRRGRRARRGIRPVQLSDWLWARCVCNKSWSGHGDFAPPGPGHPALRELLVSPEMPKIAWWLRRLCAHREDRQSVKAAVRQCRRWAPRAAWVSAVLRAGRAPHAAGPPPEPA